MAKIPFTKMHGIGNDYIYFNCFDEKIRKAVEPHASGISKRLSDRHFSIGGDGIILVLPSKEADCQMRMFNADGSEAEMCGNGIRCVAKFAYDKGLAKKNPMKILTGRGVLTLHLILDKKEEVASAIVDMGEPILEGKLIPVGIDKPKVIGEKLSVNVGGKEREFTFTAVSMGNPHCVIFVDSITDEHIFTIGPLIEKHPLFPKRVNVEFVKVNSKTDVTMRVWERGSGETLACGTGACAVGVAGALTGKTERNIKVHLLGGDLRIEWNHDNHVYKTGDAVIAFEGEVNL